MKTILYSPQEFVFPENSKTIFLGGTIEMGLSADWQSIFTSYFGDKGNSNYTFFNPRRKDWDNTWKQDIGNPEFCCQVEWELQGLDLAKFIVMYFMPGTKSPISLMELGLFARTGKLLVCCPEGFWRKGNVDIVCKKFEIPQFSNLREIAEEIKRR